MEMIDFVASTVSMMATSIEMMDFTNSTASTTSITSSLSATSAFHGGGVGAGVLGAVGATRTDTTAATVPVIDTAIAVGLESLNYRVGLPAPAITTALSTESWDLRLGGRFGPTSAIMDT